MMALDGWAVLEAQWAAGVRALRRVFENERFRESIRKMRAAIDEFAEASRIERAGRADLQRRTRERRTWPRPIEHGYTEPLRPVPWVASLRAFA